MWLFIILFIGPIVYFIVSCISDSISYEVKEAKRKKYYGKEELDNFTTYQNNNITKNDIMVLFNLQLKKYKQRYFNIEHKVFNDKKDQNYAWSIKTTKQTFGWGIVYNIRFHFSNGWVYLSFSNKEFYSGDKLSSHYYLESYDFGTSIIESTLNSCRDEAEIIWKMNGMKSEENLPFDYIPLSGSTRTTLNNNGAKKQKEKSSFKNTTQIDLLSFYRNLLGLKLRFSHDELKKSYREAVGKYHPDRYSSSSPRDRENAEVLMKQVNEAYEKLKEIVQ
jgi:curved DNA-binding protein CbpA